MELNFIVIRLSCKMFSLPDLLEMVFLKIHFAKKNWTIAVLNPPGLYANAYKLGPKDFFVAQLDKFIGKSCQTA